VLQIEKACRIPNPAQKTTSLVDSSRPSVLRRFSDLEIPPILGLNQGLAGVILRGRI